MTCTRPIYMYCSCIAKTTKLSSVALVVFRCHHRQQQQQFLVVSTQTNHHSLAYYYRLVITNRPSLLRPITYDALLGRPIYLSADLCFTGILLSFFLLSFFLHVPSELAERNATKIGHMVGSKCNLKTHV